MARARMRPPRVFIRKRLAAHPVQRDWKTDDITQHRLKTGDSVRSGETLGYLGNTGYGKEGTRGKFDVHLHFGMYIDIAGEETSVNPYEILRYLEGQDEAVEGNEV